MEQIEILDLGPHNVLISHFPGLQQYSYNKVDGSAITVQDYMSLGIHPMAHVAWYPGVRVDENCIVWSTEPAILKAFIAHLHDVATVEADFRDLLHLTDPATGYYVQPTLDRMITVLDGAVYVHHPSAHYTAGIEVTHMLLAMHFLGPEAITPMWEKVLVAMWEQQQELEGIYEAMGPI